MNALAAISKPDELRERAEAYCRRQIVEIVKEGARFVSQLSDDERDLLVLIMADAWCAGALDALTEISTKQSIEERAIAARQREIRELNARRRTP